MSKPKEEETADQVTHTKQGDACCSSDEHNDERHPEHVLEQAGLDVIQVRAETD